MAASRASSLANRLSESSPTGMRRWRANAAPPQDGRLVATATTSKPRSTRLRRLEPCPETATPIFKSCALSTRGSADHHPVRAGLGDHRTDDFGAVRKLLAVDHQDHAESHVEGSV